MKVKRPNPLLALGIKPAEPPKPKQEQTNEQPAPKETTQPTLEIVVTKPGFGPGNKYPIFPGCPPLMEHQWSGGAIDGLDYFLGQHGKCAQLIANTGEGKAFFIGYAIRYLREKYPDRFPQDKIILVITKPSIVVQTARVVCGKYGNKNVFVMSYNQITSSLGGAFIKWKTSIINNEPVEWPFWDNSRLASIFCDESQALKNFDNDSMQAKVMASAAELPDFPMLFSSATPYSRPSQTRVISCAIKPKIGPGLFLNHQLFPSWIKGICAPADPADWSPSAMRRVQDVLDPYTLRFGKAHYKHKAIIKKTMMEFATQEEIRYYQEFFDAYQQALIDKGREALGGMAAVLVAKRKFEEAAELIKAKHMAALALELEKESGSSIIIAFKHLESLRIVNAVLNNHGVKDISLIMGGQDVMERQEHIDAFQSDKNRFMLLMFDAGGAGLSLHHNLADGNKRSRKVLLPTVWNPENFVQVLGRAHRITSESTTYQYVLCLRGTVEEEQYDRLRRKCRSLKEVTRESTWTGMLDKTEQLAQLENKDDDEGENYNPDMIGDE